MYPTLEVVPAKAKTCTFLAHSAVPVSFTEEDFEQVAAGNFVVKVIYLPDPQFQDLAATGPDEVVSSRLEPGVDPIVEAMRRGSILLVIRLGNIDLEAPNTPAMDAPNPFCPPPAPPRPADDGPRHAGPGTANAARPTGRPAATAPRPAGRPAAAVFPDEPGAGRWRPQHALRDAAGHGPGPFPGMRDAAPARHGTTRLPPCRPRARPACCSPPSALQQTQLQAQAAAMAAAADKAADPPRPRWSTLAELAGQLFSGPSSGSR